MQQLPHKLANLRDAFLREDGESSAVFSNFIRMLALSIDPNRASRHLFASYPGKGILQSLQLSIQSVRDTGEKAQLLAKAADATVAAYEKALVQKQQLAKARQKSAPAVESLGPRLIQCPHCRSKIYNQDQHNQLFHPSLRAPTPRPKNAKPARKPATKLSPKAQSQPAPKQTESYRINGGKRYSPVSPAPGPSPRNRVDTEAVERRMDALRTWGGRFRDTNGSFGSYPVHDSMDDESNAG